jgi:hypothetical protein
MEKLLTLAKSIVEKKRPDYTIGNADVLKNFKSVAERSGMKPIQVWLIYFLGISLIDEEMEMKPSTQGNELPHWTPEELIRIKARISLYGALNSNIKPTLTGDFDALRDRVNAHQVAHPTSNAIYLEPQVHGADGHGVPFDDSQAQFAKALTEAGL